MSMFLAGFADSLASDIKQNRTFALEELAKEKEQTRRQKFLSEERALDRAERIDDRNWQLTVDDSKDPSNISEVLGPAGTPVYMQSVRSTGPDGKIQINSTQVTDTAQIAKFKEYKAAKEAAATKTANDLEADSLDLKKKRFDVANQGRLFDAELAATNRQGRGGGRGGSDDDMLSDDDYATATQAKEALYEGLGTINWMISQGSGKNRDAGKLAKLKEAFQDNYDMFLEKEITFAEYIDAVNNLYSKKHYSDTTTVGGSKVTNTLGNYRNKYKQLQEQKKK